MRVEWKIREEHFKEERIPALGNRFLVGNGYLGVRGTLEEAAKEQLAAVNLAGIFDQVGDGWREPLNAPNGFYTWLKVDGTIYRLPGEEPEAHLMELDYRHGIFSRKTVWKTERGMVTLNSERFASLDEVHLCGMRYCVTADFHGEIEIFTGIDGDVWDIHGPHYGRFEIDFPEKGICMTASTHGQDQSVTVLESFRTDFPCEIRNRSFDKKAGHQISFVSDGCSTYTLEKGIVVFTSRDEQWNRKRAGRLLEAFEREGYQGRKQSHLRCWENLWKYSEVGIEGDEEAAAALNYSIYHLLSIAPREGESLSIPARGLSGQTYKGAVFWDTEMFMLDFFLFTDPAAARKLVKYRIDTLEGALRKAESYGWKGAFYAWESQEGGRDACTDYNVTDVFTGRPVRTYFRDKQVHISAAVAYGILRYVEITGDDTVLEEGGLRAVTECARFYDSLLLKYLDREEYEIHDVIGPDEYHERVNNNGYTNRMAKYVLESAAEMLKRYPYLAQKLPYDTKMLRKRFREGAAHLKLPVPDENGILEQFDGYRKLEEVSLTEVRGRLLHEKEYWGGANGVASHTQIIKQADVVTWLCLFPEDYSREIQKKNWEYYEPRTEHGSSLSSCMYAMLACRCRMAEKAYPFFLKSAKADLVDGGKEWAGLVYIGGTHPAAEGGAYMTAVEGFGGLRFGKNGPEVKPCLPVGWKKLCFYVCWHGERYFVKIENEKWEIEKVQGTSDVSGNDKGV